jgi:L-asparaginase
VILLHVGGTIGMVRGDDGVFRPRPGALATALERIPELDDPRLPRLELRELEPLQDSSDVRPADWQRYADEVARAFADGADGVVLLHGTDTMAYTASALAFLLSELPGPVILTGSQLPLSEIRSDARDNLLAALTLAATPGWAEVAILFGDALLRGCRASKVSTRGFDAFASPDLPPLADVGVDIAWRTELLRRPSPGPVHVDRLREVEVVALRLFPGIGASTLRTVLRAPVAGLVLEAYGAGNAPSDPDLLAALREAHDRGVVVAVVTQCLRGGVRMGDYATGHALARAGVVPCGTMTPEAALAKLIWLLSREDDPARVRTALARDARGELDAMGAGA